MEEKKERTKERQNAKKKKKKETRRKNAAREGIMKQHIRIDQGAQTDATHNNKRMTKKKKKELVTTAVFFKRTPTRQDQVQRLMIKSHQNATIDNTTLERKWTMSKGQSKMTKPNESRKIEEILNRRTVNLPDIQVTQSETNLLRKGQNFCPKPPPPSIEDINKDIDAFARRLNLREYHTPENID